MSNAAPSLLANRFGEAGRFLRHQLSISLIWASASGVIRTGILTAAGGARLEFPPSAGDDRLGGCPGCQQRFVQGAPLLAGEGIAFAYPFLTS